MNLSEILGIKPGASREEIKRAYRAKASKLHPDREGGDEKAMTELNQAYQVLTRSDRKLEYQNDTRDSLEERIESIIHESIFQLMKECDTMDEILRKTREGFQEGIYQAGKEILRNKKSIEKYTRLQQNYLYKGSGEDSLKDKVLDKIIKLENDNRQISEELKVVETALKKLTEDYKPLDREERSEMDAYNGLAKAYTRQQVKNPFKGFY